MACVYLVAMADPAEGVSNYCDLVNNERPGLNNETCYELDLIEANNLASQTVRALKPATLKMRAHAMERHWADFLVSKS